MHRTLLPAAGILLALIAATSADMSEHSRARVMDQPASASTPLTAAPAEPTAGRPGSPTDPLLLPEPATLGLVAVGFAAIFHRRRRGEWRTARSE